MCGSSTLTHGSARGPAGSGFRTLKTPGVPSIRCCRRQSITLHLVLAVAHPIRAEGDLRARVGRAAVLRQAAPVLLFAIDRQTMTRSGSWGSASAPPAHRQPSTGRCHAITRCLSKRFERSKRSPTHPDRRSGRGMRGTAPIVLTVGVITAIVLPLLITAWSNAPTL
jgi:hypothetical protein